MDNLARKLEMGEAVQEAGTVIGADGRFFVVRTGSGDLRAKRAASCLLLPEVGDGVLVATFQRGAFHQVRRPGAPNVNPGACYVLAVLEREEGAAGTITSEGDLTVKLPGGRFEVAAQDGVGITSGKDVSVASGAVDIKAATASVLLGGLTILTEVLTAEIGKGKILAGALDSVLDRITQRVKMSYRFVEEVDLVKARQIDYTAQKCMRLHAENTMMTADELVKLDGEQIHVG
jgi:hypothetical protein